MRVSRLDKDDPEGLKRRHFEVSIDSPFTVLNCKATRANQTLPSYECPESGQIYQTSCGCPDARSVLAITSPTPSLSDLNGSGENLPTLPQAAHLVNGSTNPASESQISLPAGQQSNTRARPMHLLRAPSFNPPGFDDDDAPPPITPGMFNRDNPFAATPPPQYDVVVGTPSVDGMADYFTRLANAGLDDQESPSSDETPPRIFDERSGRVNIAHPRTPGGRISSRSMERPPQLTLDLPTQSNGHLHGLISAV